MEENKEEENIKQETPPQQEEKKTAPTDKKHNSLFGPEPESFNESQEPFMQIKTRSIVPLLSKEDNSKCFLCSKSPSYWVCVNNGIFLCGPCASDNRTYGSRISKIRFLLLDDLNEFQVELLKISGNKRLKDLLNKYKINIEKEDKLVLFGNRLLEYYRNFLYNSVLGLKLPEPPKSRDARKILENFKDNPRPEVETLPKKEEITQNKLT